MVVAIPGKHLNMNEMTNSTNYIVVALFHIVGMILLNGGGEAVTYQALELKEFEADIYNSLPDVIAAESVLKGKMDHILTLAKMAEDVAS